MHHSKKRAESSLSKQQSTQQAYADNLSEQSYDRSSFDFDRNEQEENALFIKMKVEEKTQKIKDGREETYKKATTKNGISSSVVFQDRKTSSAN